MQALDSTEDKISHPDSYVVYMSVLAQIFQICCVLEQHGSNYCSSCKCTISALAVQNSTKLRVIPDSLIYPCMTPFELSDHLAPSESQFP